MPSSPGSPRASPEPLAGSLPSPPEALLARVEELLEVSLPAAYRDFLCRNNGGVPRVARYLDGTTGELRYLARFLPLAPGEPEGVFGLLAELGDRLPPGTLPIAVEESGVVVLLGVDEPWGDRVLVWDPEVDPEEDREGNVVWTNVHAVAADFGELLERFVEG